jgi:hypothetical protein
MKCSNCNNEVENKTPICPYCGNELKIEESTLKLEYNRKGQVKIGGWLLIPIIGLLINIFTALNIFFIEGYKPEIIDYVLLILYLGTLFTVFTRKILARLFFINIYIISIVINIIMTLGGAYAMIPSILINILWIMYFIKSKRVIATFK